jgi:hypothetical protein
MHLSHIIYIPHCNIDGEITPVLFSKEYFHFLLKLKTTLAKTAININMCSSELEHL